MIAWLYASCWCIPVVCAHQGKERPLRVCIVAFYNLENFYDTVNNPAVNDDDFTPNGARHYTRRIYNDKVLHLATVLSRIGTEICRNGPSLIGVAEIENDTVLSDLVHHPFLADRGYRIIHYDSKDPRGIDVGLLYDPAVFVPMLSATLFVNAGYATRDILYVKGRLAGETIHIYVNHWPSRRGGEDRSAPSRLTAAETCRRHADSVRASEPGARIIVMGDLNDDPVSPSVLRGLRMSTSIAHTGSGQFFNPWWEIYRHGTGTLANRDSWGLFDQILVSKGLLDTTAGGWFYHKPFIFNPPFLTEFAGPFRGYPMRTWDGNSYRGGYSDHFPTYIVLLRVSPG